MMTSDTLVCTVNYSGSPIRDKSWGGFFFQKGYAFNMGVGMASVPHSYGRVWYPCVDDFKDKATYDFRITVKNEHTAVCSGTLENVSKNVSGTKTFHWKEEKDIPAYITSVAVGEYSLWEYLYKGMLEEIPVQIYSKPHLLDKIKSSFVNLTPCLHIYENYYGPYVWKRVGYVTVPFNSGAMEHNCNIAYPEYAVDGTLERETLMAHELSHHWFGNLVTCATAEDMWLNEGWASYSEALFKEKIYGKEAYNTYVRQNHEKVLKYTHLYDHGYRAVYGIPKEFTYGSTVYDKGADVIHTLRTYMGDSLFYTSLKSYLEHYAYKSVSTEKFKNYMSKVSGISLDNFFKTWIFNPGFPHFSVAEFSVTNKNKKYNTKVQIHQRLKACEFFADSVPCELILFDENLREFKTIVFVSGEHTTTDIVTDFKPENVFIDPDGKISDAAIDHHYFIEKGGTYNFDEENIIIDLESISKKMFLQVRYNFVSPENVPDTLETVFDRYWSVSGVNMSEAEGKIKIVLPSAELRGLRSEDLFLLHRKDNKSNWEEQKVNLISADNIIFESKLLEGQYCLALKK